MRGGRNNVLAGMLVLGAIVAAVAIVVLLGGYAERLNTRNYRVSFKINEGVSGLEAGSRVMLGGRPIGTVTELKFDVDDRGYAEVVEVAIAIRDDIRLREGAVAFLVSPLLGGSGQINFRSAGKEQGRELSETDVIEGSISAPGLLSAAGYGDDQKAQLQSILERADSVSLKLDMFMDTALWLAEDIEVHWPNWADRADLVMKNLDETVAAGPATVENFNARVKDFREAVNVARGIMEENREDVRCSVENLRAATEDVESFTDRLDGEFSILARSILLSGQNGLDEARGAVRSVQGWIDEQTPNVRRSFANFRLMSDQLSATLQEVRRSPWRLLYRPDRRESDFELMYDSARAYAEAVSDLRSAGETLKQVSGSGKGDPARVEELVADLERTFERFQQVEEEFLRQLRLQAGKAEPESP